MKSPEEMELSLQRLIPAAMSDRAQRNISHMISQLATAAESAPPVSETTAPEAVAKIKFPLRTILATAAALTLAAIPAWQVLRPAAQQNVTVAEVSPQITEVSNHALIDRRIITNDADTAGTVTSRDGSVLKQIQRQVHTRERYRSEKSGYLITISESRAQNVLIPKNSF